MTTSDEAIAGEALSDPYLQNFVNEPYLDFSSPRHRRRMQEALARVREQLGATYPLVIGDEQLPDGNLMASTNPARPDEVIGRVPVADAELTERAIRQAEEAFESWRVAPAQERAAVLFRAADLIRERIFELSAWMILEVGKNWAEAYGDAAEAVDFCNFYGSQALRLAAPQPLTPHASEELELRYIPLGVGAIIPPWNFPFAIPAGLVAAAVVTGNTVVFKPASDAPVIGYKLFEILRQAGLPAGVCNFLPGSGSVVGRALVSHTRVRFVVFTGSREVGLEIAEQAGRSQSGQIWIKRTILEMGGKNATIVDRDADLDAAAQGVAAAAFGYQGQKCSACSRAIVDEAVYEEFLDKLIAASQEIRVGPPDEYDNWMGPMINSSALDKALQYIQIGKQEGRLVLGGSALKGDGFFLQPTIFADVSPQARLAQDEIFAPVLAVIKARDFDHALGIANGTDYGLTGAVYCRDPGKLEQAKQEFHVGNLYLNRKCTGALVGCHPFGGFNMSGTDSKTGGRDYLLLFTQAKSIARNVSA